MCKLMILLFCPFLTSVTSLALFSAMNEEQRVFLLKRELSRLFLVSEMFVPGINKIKHGCLDNIIMEFLFSYSTSCAHS